MDSASPDPGALAAEIEANPTLSDFLSSDVMNWIETQVAQSASRAPVIRDLAQRLRVADPDRVEEAEASEARLEELETRVAGLSRLRQEVTEVSDLATSLRVSVAGSGKPDHDLARKLRELWDKLLAELETDRAQRIIEVARSGDASVQRLLTDQEATLQRSLTSATPMGATGQEEVNPAITQHRKELGRNLEPDSARQVSHRYFLRLWAEGADSDRIADILFFAPSNAWGIHVHDLLGYAGGEQILERARPEILARFPSGQNGRSSGARKNRDDMNT